jgi:DNA-binding GntR family transcriptional regulator
MNPNKNSSHQLLRSQVYEYLRQHLLNGNFKPGMFISISQLVRNLGMSRTPLREALLQLQTEGFVTLFPQRGIKINELTYQEVENIYEIIGALDSRVLISVFDRITSREISRMRKTNEAMLSAGKEKQFYKYWELNTIFHRIYLDLSKNTQVLHYLGILRQRLFGFGEIEWGNKLIILNYKEHLKIIELIERGIPKKAADYIRDVHVHLPYELVKDMFSSQEATGAPPFRVNS